MFILNRPARIVGAGIGFAKEYNAHRKASKAENEKQLCDWDRDNVSDDDDNDHGWA